ncbi:MAG: hypothetical protein L0H96_21035, partial [Humibacillus sp.]|nr:hypothetical protein [Humibacillus sp.]
PRSDLSLRVGWDRARPDERHTVELTTPTGHTYRSTAPILLPGRRPAVARTPSLASWPTQPPSLFERELERRIRAA